tara:strand:- start:1025 stop:2113 length:1089 start_codon:yes stop_codon:yes gene_type:complete
MDFVPPKYNTKSTDFFKALKLRTDEYFKSNGIDKHGNFRMYLKTFVMIVGYLAPYFLLMFGYIQNNWIYLAVSIVMGVFMAGIGFGVMHDAIHGSYSKNKRLNNILGEVINLVGGAAINWKIQHNVLHHTYTNVEEYDEDIDSPSFLRFSPNSKRRLIHRFQFLYAWFFYGFLTLNWATVSDFSSLYRYKKMGLIRSASSRSFLYHLVKIIVFRSAYFIYMIVLPVIFTEFSLLAVVGNFLVMHWIAGFILSCVFQPAHVMESSPYSDVKGGDDIPNDWASHQVMNTVNFAPKNRLLTWYVGGLNYQVEHHLFPSICHIHYSKISRIVKATAEEFNLPYNVQPTFRSALWYHMKMLKQLGRA